MNVPIDFKSPKHESNQTSQVNPLVVLCGQVNAVLVSSGRQVALQPLDLLRVFLRRQKQSPYCPSSCEGAEDVCGPRGGGGGAP